MTPIVYPASLPGPAAAPFRSAERRLTSNDPFETRAVQRDRLGTQQVTFPPFGADQKEIFEAWWRDTLVYGGAWFASDWPQPQGSIPWARRFMSAPKYQYLAGGYWRVTADFEVRGRGELPTTDDPIDPLAYYVLDGSIRYSGPTPADAAEVWASHYATLDSYSQSVGPSSYVASFSPWEGEVIDGTPYAMPYGGALRFCTQTITWDGGVFPTETSRHYYTSSPVRIWHA